MFRSFMLLEGHGQAYLLAGFGSAILLETRRRFGAPTGTALRPMHRSEIHGIHLETNS